MSINDWKSLSRDKQEELIQNVFNSTYLAATHASLNPETDAVIQEVLRVTTVAENTAFIHIYKKVKL